ncbi:hypothetical protein MUA26_05675 [Staphylococcus sp. IVB6246]|uniref:prepilin-type N-terminal cleavage/methylation domain-containing protein n=1 Tax=unclassified Staphylococcus TaxID=91994 RepID=UPI0021CE3D4E|nr:MULTISPECIES: prepilin-type N-terminal cleavage/methylation domain-containing protein [unclassified Staphylococcus]UXR68677.1 hypothetical protein MUA26_05675 [Staphylococcus sp. IVB6246]
MNKKGYTLLEALFAFFLFSIICFSLIPILQQLESTYSEAKQELELRRTLFFYLKENLTERHKQIDQYVIDFVHNKICISNIQNHSQYCQKIERFHHD